MWWELCAVELTVEEEKSNLTKSDLFSLITVT